MNDTRPTRLIDRRTPRHADRRAAGLAAQYIHELSDRHGRARQGGSASAGRRAVTR